MNLHDVAGGVRPLTCRVYRPTIMFPMRIVQDRGLPTLRRFDRLFKYLTAHTPVTRCAKGIQYRWPTSNPAKEARDIVTCFDT